MCPGVADAACPDDTVSSAGTVCNPGSGDSCDPDEVCSGNADEACPADTMASAGTVCNPGSGDLCDPDEVCSGRAGDACPADNVAGAGTVCNPGSGDICDPDEVCSGNADETCPADTFAAGGTICRPGSGDECNPDEVCTGVADRACPDDTVLANGTACGDGSDSVCDNPDTCRAGSCVDNFEPTTTVCNASLGVCDPAERCDGAGSCPNPVISPIGTVCRPAETVCDVEEVCDGITVDCPDDGFADPGIRCGDDTDNDCTDPDTCNGFGFCDPNNSACASVTDSALCLFDVSPKGVCVDRKTGERGGSCNSDDGRGCGEGEDCVDEQQFFLNFTPEGAPGYKLNAEMPGQKYYNLIYGEQGCTVGETVTLTIKLPYPYVTHGAMPVHVYDALNVGNANGTDCFAPPEEALGAYGLEISLDHWLEPIANNATGFDASNLYLNCEAVNGIDLVGERYCTYKVTATLPESCQIYINTHLEWGLVGKWKDGNLYDGHYDRYLASGDTSEWGSQHALMRNPRNGNAAGIAISDCKPHTFSHWEPDALLTDPANFTDSIENLNLFKRIRGVFGFVFEIIGDPADENYLGQPELTVELWQNGQLVITAQTDEDGYYWFDYRHKGKEAEYTVILKDADGNELNSQTVTLKGGNAYSEVNFDLTP
jgi:hypothetical protein